ncbi:MAG: SAF domain-containing protein [Clostridiales bacterium]|nr:SAF domain-containing protein [Clostridiales bacterium]
MKKTKQVIGALLIVFAIAAMVYWETAGRDQIMTEKVLVAGADIAKGEKITGQLLSAASAIPETVVAGALKPDEINKVEGKVAAQAVAKNQQISDSLLSDPGEEEADKLSPYLIKSDWIDSRSSSLRRGDTVGIYSRNGDTLIGEFEVVYVKDASDKEITDIVSEDLSYVRQGKPERGVRDRAHGSGVVDHIEILAELYEYQRILKFVELKEEKLLIVQKEGER